MPDEFTHDLFLSHSSKDKAVVRPLAERLREDGLKVWFDEWEIKPGHSIPVKIEEGLEHSRVLVLCMSANAFGSDWAQLEAGTFRFRDPLNRERRFIPLRLDDAPIKGSLAQFLYINWLTQKQEYSKLVEACRPPAHSSATPGVETRSDQFQLRRGSTGNRLNFSWKSLLFLIITASFVWLFLYPKKERGSHIQSLGTIKPVAPLLSAPPPQTPDFTIRQGYLGPAPGGVDAEYAWTFRGGQGENVKIALITGGLTSSHEDLPRSTQRTTGKGMTDSEWRNFGTASIGILCAKKNSFGISGICPSAKLHSPTIEEGIPSAAAIMKATDQLSAGDIIVVLLVRPGPEQQGYLPVEYWPDDFEAISFATKKGIIVIEDAGRGGQDLDNPTYDIKPHGFPSTWSNPFRRRTSDSGAILVSSGAPPPNTHDRSLEPDRSRFPHSNYGSAVDAQAWGAEITSLGYGDLQGGDDVDRWYTDRFSGGAATIVAGVLACVQGILSEAGQDPLTPNEARNLLRSTGSPQADASGRPVNQRIGNRPNLRELLANLTVLRGFNLEER